MLDLFRRALTFQSRVFVCFAYRIFWLSVAGTVCAAIQKLSRIVAFFLPIKIALMSVPATQGISIIPHTPLYVTFLFAATAMAFLLSVTSVPALRKITMTAMQIFQGGRNQKVDSFTFDFYVSFLRQIGDCAILLMCWSVMALANGMYGGLALLIIAASAAVVAVVFSSSSLGQWKLVRWWRSDPKGFFDIFEPCVFLVLFCLLAGILYFWKDAGVLPALACVIFTRHFVASFTMICRRTIKWIREQSVIEQKLFCFSRLPEEHR